MKGTPRARGCVRLLPETQPGCEPHGTRSPLDLLTEDSGLPEPFLCPSEPPPGSAARGHARAASLWTRSSVQDSLERSPGFRDAQMLQHAAFRFGPVSTFSCLLDGAAWKLPPSQQKVPEAQRACAGSEPRTARRAAERWGAWGGLPRELATR